MVEAYVVIYHPFFIRLGAVVYVWIMALDFCCAMEGVVMK